MLFPAAFPCGVLYSEQAAAQAQAAGCPAHRQRGLQQDTRLRARPPEPGAAAAVPRPAAGAAPAPRPGRAGPRPATLSAPGLYKGGPGAGPGGCQHCRSIVGSGHPGLAVDPLWWLSACTSSLLLPVAMTSRISTYVVALLLFCYSSDSFDPSTLPDPRDPEFIRQCVQTHNALRSQVDPPASNMLYMSWDPDLAKLAKAWAKKCLFKHNIHLKERGKVHPRFASAGENIWTGSLPVFTVKAALNSWYHEVESYNYDTNRCSKVCGHYTQVVWATSYKVGCAVHFCPTVKYISIRNAAHFVCNYGPPGNYPVRPYKTGGACSECGGEQCTMQLCQNAERDKVIEDPKWYPEWDRPACDEFCISVTTLRSLLLVLTIVASWLLPKYSSLVPASG